MTEFDNINFEEILDEGFGIVAEEINLDELGNQEADKTQMVFPILPVRNMVMFPKVITPITAGREKSKKLLEEAQRDNKLVGIISQKNPNEENPTEKERLIKGFTSVKRS